MLLTGYTYKENKNLTIDFSFLYNLDGSTLPVDSSGNAELPIGINSIKDLFDGNTIDILLYCNGEVLSTINLIRITDFVGYLIQNGKTGIYFSGKTGKIIGEFIDDYSYISNITNKLYSDYIDKSIIISDTVILQKISGKPFEIVFKLNSVEYKAILLEKFSIGTTLASSTTETNVYSKNIGFELEKIVDNKKSWTINNVLYSFDDISTVDFNGVNKITFSFADTTSIALYTPILYRPDTIISYGLSPEKTLFYISTSGTTTSGTTQYDILDFFDDGNNKIERVYNLEGNVYTGGTINLRTTDYNADDSRLILNTKEVQLGTNVTKFLDDAIILSIWKDSLINNTYIDLFDIASFDTIIDFKMFLNNNFGNALTYKTGGFNEFLLHLLDIYNQRLIDNPLDIDIPIYNQTYNIPYIINIINQIDDKWFSMFENVLPSTMIWEYIKLVKNGFIQGNKYQYKRNNLLLNDDICITDVEKIAETTLNTVVLEDTTSNYIITKEILKNTTIRINQCNYNQMFSGYYYYEITKI